MKSLFAILVLILTLNAGAQQTAEPSPRKKKLHNIKVSVSVDRNAKVPISPPKSLSVLVTVKNESNEDVFVQNFGNSNHGVLVYSVEQFEKKTVVFDPDSGGFYSGPGGIKLKPVETTLLKAEIPLEFFEKYKILAVSVGFIGDESDPAYIIFSKPFTISDLK